MKDKFFDRLVDRLGKLDADSLQSQFLRLAQEKGFLEAVFDSMQEGLVILDRRGRIEYANRAAQRLLGLSMPESQGIHIRRFLREVDWEKILELDATEWERLVNREIEVNYPEHRFLSFYLMPVPKVDARSSSGAVIILRDVTRERLNEAQSIESERFRAVTLLAAGVAHEIGNPLNSLRIHLELMRRTLANLPADAQAGLRESLEVCLQEVERLDRIISEFLQAVRPVKPRVESASLRDIVMETITFLRPELADRQILIETDLPDDLPTVRVDRQQIRQMLFNLLKNAMEAMETGGVLRVSAAATDRFVRLAIRDTGRGMSSEEMGRVFEPYYTTKPGGTGLGMMIVQRIVRDHGGELEIHSEPGRGTCVTVFLPREDQLVRMLPPGDESSAATSAAKRATTT